MIEGCLRYVGRLPQGPQHRVDALAVVLRLNQLVVRQGKFDPVGVGGMAGEAGEVGADPLGRRALGAGERPYGIEEDHQPYVPPGGRELPRRLLGDEAAERPTAQQAGPVGVHGGNRLGVTTRLLHDRTGLLDPLQPVHRPLPAEPFHEGPVHVGGAHAAAWTRKSGGWGPGASEGRSEGWGPGVSRRRSQGWESAV